MALDDISRKMEPLRRGKAPLDISTLQELSCGTEALTQFLSRHYLEHYLPAGGSKIKFVTGRPGSGKTQALRLLLAEAKSQGLLTVELSATEVWLHDFSFLYLAVLKALDLHSILQGCAEEIVREMGHDPAAIREGQTFVDYLAERHEADPISKSTIRSLLRKRFTQNPLLDNSFAACCSLLTGDILGHPVLDTADRELILAALTGSKTVKASQLRALGISPARVTKFNARHLLRSLTELIHMSGKAGLVVAVDDMERLLDRSTEHIIRYTKTRRDDAYESVRQLIDDIDSMRYLCFFFAFDRELIDNENNGIKSYPALWMRIQNEVHGKRLNLFADILDLDRYADQYYSPEVLAEMADKLCYHAEAQSWPYTDLSPEAITEINEAALYGGLGLPYLINRRVLEGGERNV